MSHICRLALNFAAMLLLAGLWGAAEAQSTFTLSAPGSVVLSNTGTIGQFSGSAVVGLQTNAPRWALYVDSDYLTGPGDLDTERVLKLSGSASAPITRFPATEGGVHQRRLIGVAGAMTNPAAFNLIFSTRVSQLSLAGTYSTVLRFWVDKGDGIQVPAGAITISANHEPFVLVTMDDPGPSINAQAFGDYLSMPMRITVRSNSSAGADVTLQLGNLLGPGASQLPLASCALGASTTEALASSKASSAALGTVTTSITVPRGQRVVYVVVRVKTAYSNAPGSYAGQLSVTGTLR
jgi:hypothetical protein